MRSLLTLALALALMTLAMPTTATPDEPEPVTVELTVETHIAQTLGFDEGQPDQDLPATATCTLTILEDDDGGDLLNEAEAVGCIEGWDHTSFEGERFVTAIDDWSADGYTCLAFMVGVCDWWEHNVNGDLAGFGIDGYSAEDGDQVRWVYQNTM